MKINIDLAPEAFGAHRQELFRNADFAVSTHRCTERGPMLTLANHRGALTVLPYQGLTIWDAEFDGYSLKSGRRSVKGAGRKRADDAAFCPAWPHQDGEPLQMQRVWIQLAGDELTLHGEGERAGGRWRIGPALRLAAQSAQFAIEMTVTNLAERPQPLRYVCHLNYDCIPDAVFRQNLPTPALLGDALGQELLCSDDLSRYVDQAEFFMLAPQGRRYVTRFATGQFNYGLRRIAVQGNRRLLAFIQPANCRPNAPEEEAGMMLGAGKTRAFCVTTGVV
ncbi:hypothetical protein FUU19_06725 [Serratia sp. Lou2A]|jgi:hypothetical protein|uniref:Aldose 1-epimerase n=2 Tax=Serratia TaxID=613 RepID=A0ABS8J678_9GAMM|nr:MULTISPECIES: hypothetical protein [unclassified Serratia (in: enterobacteria)]MBH3197588.1 hypothetical protein [Serratia marcescens]MBI6121541.1 hypothetical protein [Serratia marcescens]MCC7583217.1 hypothetical protein [Serratia sp. Lou2A]MCC7659514.1 hypothetical protein [Serratia sp. Pon4B]BEM52285.1 DUF4432 domain-containing protein [Serratia marcescens]